MKKYVSLPTHLFDQCYPSIEPPAPRIVQDLLVDCDDGCVTYSIMSIRGLFGLGSKAIAISDVALSMRTLGSDLMDAIVSSRQSQITDPVDQRNDGAGETRQQNVGISKNMIH